MVFNVGDILKLFGEMLRRNKIECDFWRIELEFFREGFLIEILKINENKNN